jgi:uncharacterized protein involved in cysteine biosynthesis
VGFVRGFLAPFRGGAYVVRHRLWGYLVLPVILGGALAGAAGVLAARYWRAEPWMSDLLEKSPTLGWIALVVFTGLAAVMLFLVVQPLFVAVFVDRLAERVEREVSGSAPAAPLLASTGRALVHAILKLALYGVALAAGLLLTAVTGVGGFVGVALAGLFLAYDGFDYPLSRRSASFGGKWSYLVRHPLQTVGFSIGTTVMYFIPLMVFVAPAFAAAGATLAFLEGASEAPKEAAEKTASQAGNVAANTGNRP